MEQFYEQVEGRIAFHEGVGEEDCPYNSYAEGPQRTAWQTGWYEAEEESRK